VSDQPEWWEVFSVWENIFDNISDPESSEWTRRYYLKQLRERAMSLESEANSCKYRRHNGNASQWRQRRGREIEAALKTYHTLLSSIGSDGKKGEQKSGDGRSHSKRVIW